jgi:hypothetical protein
MEQDRGVNKEKKEKKVSLGQRWREAQLKKTGVFWSLVAAIVLTMIIGFAWGGWVTGGSAEKIAEKMAEEAVVLRLAPMCVVQFNQDPEKYQKLIELKEAGSWKRRDYVKEQGWATMPGEEEPDSKVADACAKLLVAMSQ